MEDVSSLLSQLPESLSVLVDAFPLLVGGLIHTLALAGVSLMFMAPLALGLALVLERAEHPPTMHGALWLWQNLARLVQGYIYGMRSIPLLLLLIIVHYGVMPFVIERPDFFLSAAVTFIVFEAAYFAEIIRGGFQSVTTVEREAAKSLGLSYPRQLQLVVLPLALIRTIPALVGQSIVLVKDTALASVIGVVEFTRAGEMIYEQTYQDFEILVLQAVVYFVICYQLSRIGKHFEGEGEMQGNRGTLMLKSLQSGS